MIGTRRTVRRMALMPCHFGGTVRDNGREGRTMERKVFFYSG